MTLLSVRDLHTHIITRDRSDAIRTAHVLNGVAFDLQPGRILGLVGESGAGKSFSMTSILGLLRPPARVVRGQALFQGRDLLTLPRRELAALRGDRIGMVVQSPKASLDPLARVGTQLERVQRAHRPVSRKTAWARAEAILTAVGIPDAGRRLNAWPHELSGGMAQRVVIAMALVNEPDLLIADEPTTALDVTVQAQILDLLAAQVRDRGIGCVLITHDLGVVAQYCDDMAVMFGGVVVEQGRAGAVLTQPMHPCTQALLAATPERFRFGTGALLAGAPPDLYAEPRGCAYRARCRLAAAECHDTPPWRGITDRGTTDRGTTDQRAACWFAGQAQAALAGTVAS
jgi:oligopeptide/dipeptide ABC transporter ATP-binding protein